MVSGNWRLEIFLCIITRFDPLPKNVLKPYPDYDIMIQFWFWGHKNCSDRESKAFGSRITGTDSYNPVSECLWLTPEAIYVPEKTKVGALYKKL